jgi:hypothetical protein
MSDVTQRIKAQSERLYCTSGKTMQQESCKPMENVGTVDILEKMIRRGKNS